MDTAIAIASLSALAQETRLAIFRHLVETGSDGAVAGAIAATLGLAPATLSFHLKELSHAALVVSEQEGRFIRYSANFAAMNTLIAYLTENCCGGVPCGVSCAPVKAPRKRAPAKPARRQARARPTLGDKR